jgi:hypothetical protein
MKKVGIILGIVFYSLQAFSQTCYIAKTDAAGIDTSAYQSTLNSAACDLQASFPQPYNQQFKVVEFGYYLHIASTTDGMQSLWSKMKQDAQQETPFYLLIAKESTSQTIYSQFRVALSLPSDTIFSCIDSTKLESIANLIENTINNAYQKNGGSFYQYAEAEKAGIQKLKNIIEGLKLGNCCPLTQLEVFDNFSKVGFIGTPIQIIGPSAKPAPKNEKERSATSGYVIDYAHLVFMMDGENVDLADADVPGVSTAKVYVTKNENFCDPNEDIIGIVETGFSNTGLDIATWYHIWENPIIGEPDVLLFKRNLKKNSSPSFSTQN